jgi:membrane-associated protease RseP (regulator of RpoE activity)
VSSNLPEFPPAALDRNGNPAYPHRLSRKQDPSSRDWIVSGALLFLTFISTSFAGLFYSLGDIGFLRALLLCISRPGLIVYGFPFSIPLISILLAHELGHFFACRYYGMRCTPPYFIPAPISIAGTLGAFIKIKSQFLNRRALFDIGVAGPLAGFAFAVPALWIGISYSQLIPKDSLGTGALVFGEPIIFRLFGALALGYSPNTHDVIAHPIAMAAWVGILATSLNLLPIWQLDGGHICYAILGRSRQKKISMVSVILLIILSFLGWPTPSYLLFGLLLLIIGFRLRFYHPPTLMEEEKLGFKRLWLSLLALLILIICFTPVPISIA